MEKEAEARIRDNCSFLNNSNIEEKISYSNFLEEGFLKVDSLKNKKETE